MKKPLARIITFASIATLAASITAGCGTVRAGYESAPYQVVSSTGKFEVRDYPSLTVVETPMVRDSDRDDGSFNRLFRFIGGNNEASQKIEMTTPVYMSGSESNATMSFVMPAKMKTTEVPTPSDDSVKVRDLPAGRFAVLRFSGSRSVKTEAESLQRLRAWMQALGLKETSSPIYGYFDPPWTPAPLRRNEVLIQTGPED